MSTISDARTTVAHYDACIALDMGQRHLAPSDVRFAKSLLTLVDALPLCECCDPRLKKIAVAHNEYQGDICDGCLAECHHGVTRAASYADALREMVT